MITTTQDKKAVAQSLAKSAMHSFVKVPKGFDFQVELEKVNAELQARAKYRFFK
jgi:hypothetical protein